MDKSEYADVSKLHESSNYDFLMQPLDSPLILNRILSSSGDRVIAAGFHKVCYETICVVDTNARPQEKWAALRELNEELSTRAFRQGIDLTHAAISPIGFDKRLLQLGWKPDRDGCRLWSLETNEVCNKSSE